MALIKCDECSKEISDKAKTCPICGCPTKFSLEKAEKTNKAAKSIFFILGIGSVIGFAIYQGLRPPCLAGVKKQLNSPDSLKVVSWDRETYKLVVSATNGFGARNRIKFFCMDDIALPQ